MLGVRLLGGTGLGAVAIHAVEEVTTNGPDFQGIAALVTAVGGIIAILLSAWTTYRANRKANDPVKDEIISELLEQLIEAKKDAAPTPRKRTRRSDDADR